jgi:hypothetical protein
VLVAALGLSEQVRQMHRAQVVYQTENQVPK